jgi:hypothetical protein
MSSSNNNNDNDNKEKPKVPPLSTATSFMKQELTTLKTRGISRGDFKEVKFQVDDKMVTGWETTFHLKNRPFAPGIKVSVYSQYIRQGVANFEVVAGFKADFARKFTFCASRNLISFLGGKTTLFLSDLVETWARVIYAVERKMQDRLEARQQGTYFNYYYDYRQWLSKRINAYDQMLNSRTRTNAQ